MQVTLKSQLPYTIESTTLNNMACCVASIARPNMSSNGSFQKTINVYSDTVRVAKMKGCNSTQNIFCTTEQSLK